MKIKLDKPEQTPKLTKEMVIEKIISSIDTVQDEFCSYRCPLRKDNILCGLTNEVLMIKKHKSGIGLLSRTESCLILKPIDILQEFSNKLISSQKQNDMNVDVDSIIFDKEK